MNTNEREQTIDLIYETIKKRYVEIDKETIRRVLDDVMKIGNSYKTYNGIASDFALYVFDENITDENEFKFRFLITMIILQAGLKRITSAFNVVGDISMLGIYKCKNDMMHGKLFYTNYSSETLVNEDIFEAVVGFVSNLVITINDSEYKENLKCFTIVRDKIHRFLKRITKDETEYKHGIVAIYSMTCLLHFILNDMLDNAISLNDIYGIGKTNNNSKFDDDNYMFI